jgi:hypothetical protein
VRVRQLPLMLNEQQVQLHVREHPVMLNEEKE